MINYIIVITAERLLKLKPKTWRVITAAFVGALFSLAVFIDIRSFLFSVFIKIISTLAVTLIAFKFDSFKEFLKELGFTLLISFMFSGLMIFIYQLFRPPNMLIVNDIVYFELDPLILIAVTAFIYAVLYLAEKIFKERIKSSVVRLSVSIHGKCIDCPAKVDTGCDLTEPFSSSPVIIIDKRIFEIADDEEKRVIPCTTISGSSVLYAVKADAVSINEKAISREIYIASGDVDNSSYSALINSDILR